MKEKSKTTTQRLYLEDFKKIKEFQQLNKISTFAEALHEYIEFFKREEERLSKLIYIKNQKLYEVLEVNKALQKRIKELEENIEEWRIAYNQLADKLQKYEERIKELESQLENGFWQRVKRFFGL